MRARFLAERLSTDEKNSTPVAWASVTAERDSVGVDILVKSLGQFARERLNHIKAMRQFICFLSLAFWATFAELAGTLALPAAQFKIGAHTFTLPDGFEIELVAGPPLVDRPIVADFDEQGRLYVADSSGSNDKVHRAARRRSRTASCGWKTPTATASSTSSTVFADKMMFPEGTMWLDGSLYVAAPPSIWKLTDTDGDGVADKREEWFQGKTLTGCANDLHGPYSGPTAGSTGARGRSPSRPTSGRTARHSPRGPRTSSARGRTARASSR